MSVISISAIIKCDYKGCDSSVESEDVTSHHFYLYGEVHDEIYVNPPSSWVEVINNSITYHYCPLHKRKK